MKLKKYIILILTLWGGVECPVAHAQTVFNKQQGNPNFRHISLKEGLSQSTVYCIMQDTLGAIWFGTQDGLDRYDGIGFDIFKPQIDNKWSLISNEIRALYKDKKGNIWIGGNGGLSKFNYSTEKFYNYKFPHTSYEWFVSSIVEDSQNRIWMGTSNGEIWTFDKQKKHLDKISYSKYNINKIQTLFLEDQTLWIGTDIGLFKMNIYEKKLRRARLPKKSVWINDIIKAKSDSALWLGTEGDGLIYFNYEQQKLTYYTHKIHENNSVIDNNVRSLSYDSKGRLWIGTFRGLSILDTDKDSIINERKNLYEPYSLSQNSVRSILRDHDGAMWLGTYYGGVNYYNPKDIKFNSIINSGRNFSLDDDVVSVIKQDKNGDLWVGTNDGGLNLFYHNSEKVKYFTHKEDDSHSLSSNNIKAIAFNNNKVLIGTHNAGLNILNPASGKVIVYKHNNNQGSISGDMVYALLKDHKNRIWVGTRRGLDRFIPSKNLFKHFYVDRKGKRLSSDEITYLFEDSKKRIWVGTTHGVNIFYPENKVFESLKVKEDEKTILSNNFITSINEDYSGKIWIGTKNGLIKYNEKERKIIRYTTKNGLPNDVIYGILFDNYNNVWISTNKGLACMNIADNSVRIFTTYNGLQSNQFNLYSFFKTSKNVMLFGGIKGLTYFKPKNIAKDSLNLKIRFTKLAIGNQLILPHDSTGVLDESITHVNTLTFKPSFRQFHISFRTFNYVSPKEVKYLYKLTGFDNKWHITSIPEIRYSDLPAGDYSLKVKAKGPLGEYSPIDSMKIEIPEFWYKATWVYILFSIIFSFILIFILRVISINIKEKKLLKAERIEKQNLIEVNKMKVEFFTNVSHEFRTPLTLIISPLEELLRKNDLTFQNKSKIEMVHKNANRLLRMINQLLDFRKAGSGEMELILEKGDMVQYINNIYLSFVALAKMKKISYQFHSEQDTIVMFFDKNYIEKALYNIISNAFKYTEREGKIDISLEKTSDDLIEIRVKDSGCGISQKYQSVIFKRFFRSEENRLIPGTGIGLALTKRLIELHGGTINLISEKEKGTTFIIQLPIKDGDCDHIESSKKKSFLGSVKNENVTYSEYNYPDSDVVNQKGRAFAKTTILLVEDNEDILRYMEREFSKFYNVETAADGEQAMNILNSKTLDFIISDIMLPKVDGIKLCTQVKKNIKTCHIPFILLTAKSGVDNKIVGLEIGADDYITKPFSLSVLLTKVDNILKSRERLKEHYAKRLEVVPEKIANNKLDEAFLEEAKNIVEEYIDDSDFSVKKLSEKLFMSRSNLYLKLKAITDESVSDFIKRIRFSKATELIEEGKYNMSEIAYMVGFSSSSYFSTSFKSYFGCLPSEYNEKKNTKKH